MKEIFGQKVSTEKFGFAPIAFKLGSAYVLVHSKKIKKKSLKYEF